MFQIIFLDLRKIVINNTYKFKTLKITGEKIKSFINYLQYLFFENMEKYDEFINKKDS